MKFSLALLRRIQTNSQIQRQEGNTKMFNIGSKVSQTVSLRARTVWPTQVCPILMISVSIVDNCKACKLALTMSVYMRKVGIYEQGQLNLI